jgi:uncharacterized protein (TIGR02271 family)
MEEWMKTETAQQWIGYPVIDSSGNELGRITKILVDDETTKPEWAVVSMGFLGREKPVPLANAQSQGEKILVNFSKDQVKSAPDVEQTDHLSQEEEIALFEHYGIPYGGDTVTSQSGGPQAGRPTQSSKSGQTSGERVPLHEEELVAKKQTVQRGEARVGKEVISEQKQIDVPVTREEPYIERQPVGKRPAESEIGEGEIRVPLMAEQATAEKQSVVKEEVKVGKRPVQETQRVTDTVRREEPVIEGESIREPQTDQ